MKNLTALGFALALLAWHAPTQAQQPAVAMPPVPDPASITIPPAPCEKPPTSAGAGAEQRQLDRLHKQVDVYRKCINLYATDIAKRFEAYNAIAIKFKARADDAVTEFNAYIEELNKNAKED